MNRNTGIANVLAMAALTVTVLLASPCRSDTNSPLGINLWFHTDWGTDWAFVDMMKSCRGWWEQPIDQSVWNSGALPDLRPDGYPASLRSGYAAATVFGSNTTPTWRYGPAGDYVLLWDGGGTLELPWSTVVSSSANRKVVRLPGNSSVLIRITSTTPGDPVRNVRLIQPDVQDVPALAALYPAMRTNFLATYVDTPFHPVFLQHLRKFNTIRFMDWGHTNHQVISSWSERCTPDWASQADEVYVAAKARYITKGVALEYQIRLCNLTSANGWFNIPHAADDNYIRQTAVMIRDSLKPCLRAYVEYTNEYWNGSFDQQAWLVAAGEADPEITRTGFFAATSYYSKRFKQIAAIFAEVFGQQAMGTKVIRVMGTQVGNNGVADDILSSFNAYQSCDALAIAPYFGPTATSLDQLFNTAIPSVHNWDRQKIAEHIDIAARYNVRLICYEAGQHIITGTDLTLQAQRDARMKTAYTNYYNMYRDARGVTNTTRRAELMCHHTYISAFSSSIGCWGLLENLGQDTTTSPKYMATAEWIQNNSKWWTESDVCQVGTAAPRQAPAAVLRHGGRVRATLHDLSGRRIAGLTGTRAGVAPNGSSRWQLPASLAPGSYVVRVEGGGAGECVSVR